MAFLSGTVWAAGDRGYVSDDGGENWSPVIGGEDPFSKEIFSFDFPQGNDQTIYVGTEMNGFVQSTDGGDTWQEKQRRIGRAAGARGDRPAQPDRYGLCQHLRARHSAQRRWRAGLVGTNILPRRITQGSGVGCRSFCTRARLLRYQLRE